MREDDPKRSALLTILLQLKEALGIGSAHTMREINQRRDQSVRFFQRAARVAANRSGNVISNERLGRWLKANEGKITNGLSIARAGSVDGYPLWRLTKAYGVKWGLGIVSP